MPLYRILTEPQPHAALLPVATTGNDTAPIALSFCSGAMDLTWAWSGQASRSCLHPRPPWTLGRPSPPPTRTSRSSATSGTTPQPKCVPPPVSTRTPTSTWLQRVYRVKPSVSQGSNEEWRTSVAKCCRSSSTWRWLWHPRYVVVENVRGLLMDAVFHHVVEMLRDGGYVVSWNIYDAAYFGVAQRRNRLIVIASHNGRVPHLTPTHSDCPGDGLPAWRTLRDAIGDMTGIDHHAARYPEKRLKWWRLLKPGQNWRHLPHPGRQSARRPAKRPAGRLATTGGSDGTSLPRLW